MDNADLDKTLRAIPVPPADTAREDAALDHALAALAHPPDTHTQPSAPSWTWRDWLWPSPFAWGAMAMIWIIPFAEKRLYEAPTSQPVAAQSHPRFEHRSLTAIAEYQHDFQQLGLERDLQ